MGVLVIAVMALVATCLVMAVLWDARRINSPAGRSFSFYPDHVRTAAFRFINMPSVTPSYLGGGVEQIAARRVRIVRKREEAANIKDSQLRNCVLKWLDFYERKLVEQSDELRDRTTRKRLDAYVARQKIEDNKARDLMKSEGLL